MAVADKLKEHGWYLSEEGLSVLGVNGNVGDIKAFIRSALDVDLREISCGSFPEEIGKSKVASIPGKIVVQIQKIRNISAPKANEESQAAPRMLKLSLSDGQTCCQAIEMERISSISLNTPPGTKLFLKTDIPLSHGILLLKPSSVEVLGGKVPHLVEKWELNRSLAKHIRGRVGEEGGPPPWIPFGEKILKINSQDRNFKSLDNSKDKENRDNTEFEAQRKDAIAEAARGGANKVFGGGNKPLLDHNVQQIVDHGFSVEQAEYALRLFRNSVDRALKSLQKKEEGQRRDDRERDRRGGEVRVKEERPERRKRGVREEEAGAPPKPSGKVTLFDFFEDKLPVQNDKEQDSRNFVSNGVITGVDRRLTNAELQMPRSITNKGSRPERVPSHGQQQPQQQHQQLQHSRRGGSRGGGSGGNSGGNSGRGGRGNHMSNSSNTWGGTGDVRGGGSGSLGYLHREERSDRGRQGGNVGNQTQTLPPQKPPRFQNQQRLQQQQHHQQQHHQQQQQQHHHQQQQQQHHQQQQQHHQQQQHQQHHHQQQQQQQQQHSLQHHQPHSQQQQHVQQQQQQQNQHQLNQDGGYGQQSWLSAYNDSYSNDNWPISSTVNNGKLRDDYVNHGDSYLSTYDSGRNMAPRPGFSAGYDIGLEGQVNRGLGMKMDRLGSGRQFSSQQDALTQKLSSLQVQGPLGREGFGYSNRHQGPSTTQNQLYNMNYSYKDPSPSPAQPLGSPPDLNIPPGYRGGGSGGDVYNTPSNHFLPEQKPWQWHEGDKCMAKYWEDNMYYNAEVTGVSERTCVVRFVEYGNFEEVLQDHCIPFTQDELGQTIQSSSAFSSSSDTLSAQNNNNQNHFSGVLEFRRGGTRPYVKGGSGSGTTGGGVSERKPPRAQQQMYVPPAQRK